MKNYLNRITFSETVCSSQGFSRSQKQSSLPFFALFRNFPECAVSIDMNRFSRSHSILRVLMTLLVVPRRRGRQKHRFCTKELLVKAGKPSINGGRRQLSLCPLSSSAASRIQMFVWLAILHKNFAVRLEERPVVQNIVPLEPSLVVVITCMIECENA